MSSKKHIPVHDDGAAGGSNGAGRNPDAEIDIQESTGDTEIAARQAEDELAQRLSERDKENAELLDRLQRSAAEFDNYRRRVSREKEDLLKYGTEKIAFDMLPVADNFERALEQAKAAQDTASVIEGVEMIYKQFLSTLEKYKVRPFDSLGESFNPERHEAMLHQPSHDHAENTVMGELQRGYVLDDKLLRPARVIVSRGPAESCGTPEEG